MIRVITFATLLLLTGCSLFNYGSIEAAHTSHPFAGPPFGPTSEEDSLDRINGCIGKESGAWYYEGCVGYMYVDGGFYGPRVTFDGRVGRKFRFGERR